MWVLGIKPTSSGRATSALNPKPSLQYPTPTPTPFGDQLNLSRIDLVWGRSSNSSSLPVAILPLRSVLSSSSSVPGCLSGTPLGRQNSVCNGGPSPCFFFLYGKLEFVTIGMASGLLCTQALLVCSIYLLGRKGKAEPGTGGTWFDSE